MTTNKIIDEIKSENSLVNQLNYLINSKKDKIITYEEINDKLTNANKLNQEINRKLDRREWKVYSIDLNIVNITKIKNNLSFQKVGLNSPKDMGYVSKIIDELKNIYPEYSLNKIMDEKYSVKYISYLPVKYIIKNRFNQEENYNPKIPLIKISLEIFSSEDDTNKFYNSEIKCDLDLPYENLDLNQEKHTKHIDKMNLIKINKYSDTEIYKSKNYSDFVESVDHSIVGYPKNIKFYEYYKFTCKISNLVIDLNYIAQKPTEFKQNIKYIPFFEFLELFLKNI